MKFAIISVVIICIVSLVSTIMVARSVESQYGKFVKRNITNLSLIYIVLFFVLAVGVTSYIVSIG